MAPQIPGTGVFSLKSTAGLSSSHDTGLGPLELEGLQSCLAVSRSAAESRNLHRRGRAGAQVLYGDQGPAFVNYSPSDFGHEAGATGVYAAGGSLGHVPVDAGVSIDHSALDYGQVTMDDPRNISLDATEDRHTRVFPSPSATQSTPLLLPAQYFDKSTLDSPFDVDTQFASWDSGFRCNFGTLITPISLVPSKCMNDDMQGLSMGPPSVPIPRQRRPKSQRKSTLMTILRDLQGLKYTVIDLLMAVLDGSGDFKVFRTALFSPRTCTSLVSLLDTLVQDDKGRPIVTEWMFPHALRLVCDKIHSEMDGAKQHLRMHMGDVSPELIEDWDIQKIMGPVAHDITPTLSSIIEAARETKLSRAKPKTAKSKNRYTASLIIMSQLHFLCSRNSAKGPNTMSKVQLGTFAVIYELLNARAEDMNVEPMIKRLSRSSPLIFSDIRMTPSARQSYASQTAVTIVKILTKYVKGFELQASNALLQHTPRRPLPSGHKTVFHPLQVSTIEEASIDGNLLVHDDVYLVQLKRPSDELDKMAIPTFNDQLTNTRIWGGQHIRKKDVSHWERREIFQLAGTLNQVGSLTHLFAILEKTRLGGEHPDYHTLLSALTQILHGLILNAWLMECDYSSLSDFATAVPMPQDLLECAHRIFETYAVPGPSTVFRPTNAKAPPKDLLSGEGLPTLSTDVVRNNVALLTRDLLYVAELVDAMSTGDFDRIEDILPSLACMFRGSGSNNYSMEILHLIFSIKEVWTPVFANIIRDNLLVNLSGLPGHAMGIDLNIEHLIRYLKSLFAAKGIYSNWDRLGNVAAGINYIQLVKKQVTRSLKSGYRGSTHTDVDTSALVWRIANKAKELELQCTLPNRDAKSTARPVVDIFTAGYKKFQTSSLATFNKKIADIRQGRARQLEPEADEITPCQVVEGPEADNSDPMGELSTLHKD
ncbi:hypothetical protein EI94DRAFT_1818072 [Lactarius quietus]|nr:hypothetical protein EI94DRAFT_1818072 [Lactarius quietus]